MTAKELLEEYYDMEMNNVFSYSGNYLMSRPKKGYEREWEEAREKVEIIKYLLGLEEITGNKVFK